MTKEEIAEKILQLEGGYVDHPQDTGGPTNHGITQKLARAYGFSGDMRSLSIGAAKNILIAEFWNRVRGDDLLRLDLVLAAMVFDMAVNCGPKAAGGCLQSSINLILEKGGFHPATIAEDGVVGSKTLNALNSVLLEEGCTPDTAATMFLGLRLGYYASMPNAGVFIRGWRNRAISWLS